MTLEEKLLLLKSKGYTANGITGEVISPNGKILCGKDQQGYIIFSCWNEGREFKLRGHQYVWFFIKNEVPKEIDHINENKSDNRIENLRNVNRQLNMFNQKKVKGYYYDKINKKYAAQIMVSGKWIFLGRFLTEEEASKAYLDAKKIYHTFTNFDTL